MHTDDTHFDTPTPTYDYESDRQPASLIPPRGSRRSRRTALGLTAIAVMAVLLGALFGSALGSTDDGDDAAAAFDLAAGDVGPAQDEAPTDVDATTPEPGVNDDQPGPIEDDQPAPADPEPADDDEPADDPEPEPDPEPTDPCDLLADGQTLAVSSEEIKLPVGQFAGELLITNCGDEATQWSATTLSPDVQLGVADGTLAAGATVDVQFALDPSAIAGSKLSFFITVNEPGFETKVMVTATKVILNPGIVIPELELKPNIDL